MNNALMCTVGLENPGVVYESDGTGQQYYGKATLYDAEDNQKLEVENTRLNSQGSQIALTTRFQTMEFANLYIAYQTQVAEGGRVDSTLTSSTEPLAYTPDKHLLDTLDMGKAPDTPDTNTETDTAQTPAEPQEPAKKGCKSLLSAPMALVASSICALCTYAFASKKKKG